MIFIIAAKYYDASLRRLPGSLPIRQRMSRSRVSNPAVFDLGGMVQADFAAMIVVLVGGDWIYMMLALLIPVPRDTRESNPIRDRMRWRSSEKNIINFKKYQKKVGMYKTICVYR